MSYDQNLADCEVALADLATVVSDQSQKLNAANQLLGRALDVLEGFLEIEEDGDGDKWFWEQAKPLLDKLQALKKEGPDG